MGVGDGDEKALARENHELKGRIAQLEQQLSESRGAGAFLESVLAAVPVFISNLDPDLKIRFLNRYQPGHSLESVVGVDVFDYVAEEDRELAREHIERARATGEVTSYTVHKAVGAQGEYASYLTRVAPVREPDGRVGACLAFMDISEETRRERALHEMQEALTLALDATGLGLWSWDLESGQSTWDDRMRSLHACDGPLVPETYAEQLVHPDDREFVIRTTVSTLESGASLQAAYRIVRPDGTRWVLAVGRALRDESGKVCKLMGGVLDVTRQRELEEQLQRTQKMEALAGLTAGVAHNFNNMLAVITPILELSAPLVPAGHRKLIHGASHAARRAAELVQQLMTYAGQSACDRRVDADVGTLVEAAVDICRRGFGPGVALSVEHFPTPLTITCNPGQIEQVLINLLLNARDAVAETATVDGKVLVRVRSEGDADREAEAAQPSRRSVFIDVIDNGPGLSEGARTRLFEPFFTTKSVGKGTGLGLATSSTIAREHEGELCCAATGPDGSRFTLSLPLSAGLPPRESLPATSPQPAAGTEVLLVDDDEAVRDTLKHVLTEAGLRVVEARHGSHALEVLRASRQPQVVLLDRTMPGGPGERFLPAIRALAPKARIILLSGRAVEPEVARLADAVVAKPVTAGALTAAIEQVLSDASD